MRLNIQVKKIRWKWLASLHSIESLYCSATESFRDKRFMQRKSHPRRPGGSQSGREKRRDATFQARAEKPLGTDSHRTISKQLSECWLLIGHKKCFVSLSPIGEQFLLSSFREFVHDGYYLATVARFVQEAFLTRQRITTDESKMFRMLSAGAIQFALRKFCFW